MSTLLMGSFAIDALRDSRLNTKGNSKEIAIANERSNRMGNARATFEFHISVALTFSNLVPQALQNRASASCNANPQVGQFVSMRSDVFTNCLIKSPSCQGIKAIPVKIIKTVRNLPP